MAVGDLLWVDRWWEGPNEGNLRKDDGFLKGGGWGDKCPGPFSKKRKYRLVPSTFPPYHPAKK